MLKVTFLGFLLFAHICVCVCSFVEVTERFVSFCQKLSYKKNIYCVKGRLRRFILTTWSKLLYEELIVSQSDFTHFMKPEDPVLYSQDLDTPPF